MKLTNWRGSFRLCSSSSSTFGARRKAPRAELFGDSCSVLIEDLNDCDATAFFAYNNFERSAHLFCCESMGFCNLTHPTINIPIKSCLQTRCHARAILPAVPRNHCWSFKHEVSHDAASDWLCGSFLRELQ